MTTYFKEKSMDALPLIFLSYVILFGCLIACDKQPLNRVHPKMEVIYTKDPCDRNKDEVSDNVDGERDQEFSSAIQPESDESRAPASNEPAESLRMGEWRSLYAPPILGGYDDIGRTPDSAEHERER